MANRNTIRISNPSLEWNQITYLEYNTWTSDTFYVLDTAWFPAISTATDYYFAVVWGYWNEKSEIVTIQSKTNNPTWTFTTSSRQFPHSAWEPVVYIPYNQIRIYWMEEEWDTPVLVSTIEIDPTNHYTSYTYSWDTYSYFLVRYYRSITTAVESADSDTFSINTFTQYSLKNIIEQALTKAQTKIDENQWSVLNWNRMISFANEAMQVIKLRKRRWNFLHKTTSTNSIYLPMTTTSWTRYIENIPEDISMLDSVKIDWNRIDFISRLKYDLRSSTDTWKPSEYTIKNGWIYLYPTPDSSYSVELSYYRDPATLDSLTDEVDKEFVYPVTLYLWAQAAYARWNDKRWDKLDSQFNTSIDMLIEEHTWEWQSWDAESIEETSIYNQE